AHDVHNVRILPGAPNRVVLLRFTERRDISEALLPLLIDVDHAPCGFKKLRQPRGVVADVVDKTSIERSRGTVPLGLQTLEIFLAIGQVELDQAVLARNRVPLLTVEWRF